MTKIPGLNKHGNITLKWGANGTKLFWDWIFSAMNGQVQRANGSIKLFNENRQEVMRWNFTRAWPTKYTGPSLNAGTNEIAMDSVELAVEQMVLDPA
jgi:phage tail-like protein